MPVTYTIPEFETFIIGLFVLLAGQFVCSKARMFQRISIPPSVVGGILTTILISIFKATTGSNIIFATGLRDIFILIFFVSLGFTAKLNTLRTGGKSLFLICSITVLLLLLQNVIGIGMALLNHAHPFYGLLAGSVSFVGGIGTALAWSAEATAMGLKGAEVVGVSTATMAVAVGAIVSGPFVTWIIKRHKLIPVQKEDVHVQEIQVVEPKVAASTHSIIQSVLIISIATWMGISLNKYASLHGILLPGFLCALLAGMFITNLSDVRKRDLPLELIDRAGDISLQIFLAISMMSLNFSSIGSILLTLSIVIVLQVILSAAIAYFILFRSLGKDYDAAVIVGGFLGFAISSMPIAMATMEQITKRFGPSAKAILLITLAGSFFVDIANALIVKGFIALFPFITP